LRWVKLGCTLLTTLLASPDGRRFLVSEDDLLKQLTRSFAQLDPVRPLTRGKPSLTYRFIV
jgi:rapamycin-insensitive companion of mTOR